MMTRIIPVLLALITLLMVSSAALAQEPARYNFASAQGSHEIKVTPDGESPGSIYFYNIDGNQITHIVLEVSQAPANWQVAIQPPLGETQVDIGGQIVTVNENLYIEPSQVLSEKAEDTPSGIVCITIPQRGYALAKEAKIIVRVPGTEKIGTKGDIIISATAQWLGQSGAVAIQQNRDFNFSVEVIAKTTGIQEKILGKTGTSGDTGKWLPVIIGAAVVVLGAMLILLYIRRRRD
jgi:hypothetical protein